MSGTLGPEASPLLAEIAGVFERMPSQGLDDVVAAILAARRIVTYGQGRAGLVMQGLTMRLYHAGFDAHVAGTMSAPPVGPGDLFLVCAATGDLPTGLALIASARKAGAEVALVTGVPEGRAHADAKAILHLPAKTLAERPELASRLPMGSQFELAFMLSAEMIVARLVATRNVDEQSMKARHTNLL